MIKGKIYVKNTLIYSTSFHSANIYRTFFYVLKFASGVEAHKGLFHKDLQIERKKRRHKNYKQVCHKIMSVLWTKEETMAINGEPD